jgi:hypothetical protein
MWLVDIDERGTTGDSIDRMLREVALIKQAHAKEAVVVEVVEVVEVAVVVEGMDGGQGVVEMPREVSD